MITSSSDFWRLLGELTATFLTEKLATLPVTLGQASFTPSQHPNITASVFPHPLTEVLRSWEDIISGSNDEFNAVSIHSPTFSPADLPRLNIMLVHPLPFACSLRSPCFPTVTYPKPCFFTLYLPKYIPHPAFQFNSIQFNSIQFNSILFIQRHNNTIVSMRFLCVM